MKWFTHVPKLSRKYFDTQSNQILFMNEIAQKYKLNTASDWKRISSSLIIKSGGKVSGYKYCN